MSTQEESIQSRTSVESLQGNAREVPAVLAREQGVQAVPGLVPPSASSGRRMRHYFLLDPVAASASKGAAARYVPAGAFGPGRVTPRRSGAAGSRRSHGDETALRASALPDRPGLHRAAATSWQWPAGFGVHLPRHQERRTIDFHAARSHRQRAVRELCRGEQRDAAGLEGH